VYALTAPTELLLPDGRFALAHLRDARRFYLTFVWDELPHELALALVLVAIACLARGRRWYVPAGAAMALALAASAFGGSMLAIALACFVAVYRKPAALAVAAVAYLAACPFLPPSLLRAIRANAELFPESAWTPMSLAALAATVAGWGALWFLSRNWKQAHLRFFLLLAWVVFAIPFLYRKYELHFVPQPGRYKVELGLALALLAVFGAARLAERWPRWLRAALALPLLWMAGEQVVRYRRFSKEVLRPVDIAGSIEYRTAKWLEANLPGRRVMAAGSIAQWMNAFAPVQQFGGGSYPTAPNPVQQIAEWGIHTGGDGPARNDEVTLLWLKAFGVDAVIVPGLRSPEFWKPFREPHRLAGLLPVLWNEDDTAICAAPRRNASLAHVIPAGALPGRRPANWNDTGELRRLVAALEDPANPPAEFSWQARGRARIRAHVSPGQVLAVQVNHHAGWKARANGRPAPVERDGLGQIVIRPACDGACEVELAYDGGWEGRLSRLAGVLALLAGAVMLFRNRM
jgi:hypothetical protein